MSHLSVFRVFWKTFSSVSNRNEVIKSGEQEKESIIHLRLGKNRDPRDGFFYPTLILMIDSYNAGVQMRRMYKILNNAVRFSIVSSI